MARLIDADMLLRILQSMDEAGTLGTLEDVEAAIDMAWSGAWCKTEDELPAGDGMVLCIASGKAGNVTLRHAVVLGYHVPQEGWILEAWPEAEDIAVQWWMDTPLLPEEIRSEYEKTREDGQ